MGVLTIGNQRDHIGHTFPTIRTFNEFAHHCGEHRIGDHDRGQLERRWRSGNNRVSSVANGVAVCCCAT